MVPKHTHSQAVVLHPVAEAKGLLGSIHMVISCYVSPTSLISRLGTHFRLLPTLLCIQLWLLLQFHLHRPRHCRCALHFNTLLLALHPFHPCSWTPLFLQTQLRYRTSHNVLGCVILVAEDVCIHLL